MEIAITIVVIILGLFLLLYVMAKNIGRGVFKSFSSNKITENAYKDAPENSPWFSYIKIMNEEVLWLDEKKPEDVYINAFDGIKLHGFYLNCNSNKTFIYFHGFNSNGYKEGAVLAHIFYDKGYNVIIVQQRGHDQSDNAFVTFGVHESRDVKSWVDYVNGLKADGEIIIAGMSMGAGSVLSALSYELPNVKLAIADCGYTNAYDILLSGFHFNKFVSKTIMNFVYKDYLNIAKADLKKNTPLDGVKKTNIPVLFVVGSNDTECPVSESEALCNACNSRHELLVVDDAIHASSIYKNKEEYVKAIEKFIL